MLPTSPGRGRDRTGPGPDRGQGPAPDPGPAARAQRPQRRGAGAARRGTRRGPGRSRHRGGAHRRSRGPGVLRRGRSVGPARSRPVRGARHAPARAGRSWPPSRRCRSRSSPPSTGSRWAAGASWPWRARWSWPPTAAVSACRRRSWVSCPGFGGTVRLRRSIGRGPAMAMMLTGRPIPAQTAWQLGLLSAPPEKPEDLPATAAALAAEVAELSRVNLALVLESARSSLRERGGAAPRGGAVRAGHLVPGRPGRHHRLPGQTQSELRPRLTGTRRRSMAPKCLTD